MNSTFNNHIKQLLLLGLIIILIVVSIQKLHLFMPGLLGALTLYILSRANYLQLVYNKKWKKGRAALLYILFYLVLLGIPIFLAITLASPKLNAFLNDPTATVDNIKQAVFKVQEKTGITFATEKSLSEALEKVIAFIPSILNSTATLVANLATMLFFLYYMLYHSQTMEKTVFKLIPLKDANTTVLAAETKKVVKANALGIPLISIIQGLTATLGYFIFGVKEWALWGFLTGIFAFFPIVGTMIVWVPLVIYTYIIGDHGMALGLMLYSVIITGNVDYLARMSLMKKLADVHPIITVLGVIVGLGLFGFIGLIFGPLLVSYIITLFKIYMNEFVVPQAEEYKPENISDDNKKGEEGK